jgi:predicted ATPase
VNGGCDVEQVAPAIADALGVPGAATVDDSLAGHLRDRRLLLVLDNLEQVLAAGRLVTDLLAVCPGLTVLATSRAPLTVRGEVERPVRPLPLPPTQSPRAEDVLSAPAGQLFVDRARATVPEFEVSESDAPAVAAICWRLGGLPLAIELAAPRVRLLDPSTLLNRLDHALAVAWARDLPTRQQTIQATLDWSHDLLEPQEQRLLALLGVFTGGFDLAAVEAVAVGEVDEEDVLPALEALVLQSLVTVSFAPGVPASYALLEPIREYALSRLREVAGREAAVRRRHRAHFLALAEQAAPKYAGPEQVLWLQCAEWEAANFRGAIVNALDDGDAETAGRLCWAMWIAWWMSGHPREGRAFAAEVLRHAVPDPVRVRSLLVHASLAYAQGDIDVARRSWQEALHTATASADGPGVAYATAGGGLCDVAEGKLDTARAQFFAAIEQAERVGEQWLLSLCRVWVGTTLLASGDPGGAIEHAELGLENARARGDRLVAYVALFTLAEAALALGELDNARTMLREGIALSMETGDRPNLAFYLDALAVVSVEQGDMTHAARLIGAAASVRDVAGAVVYRYYLPDEQRRASALATARQTLGPTGYDVSYAEGYALDVDGAAALASQS